MQTNLLKSLLATTSGQHAEKILRKCVHCGFCNATCPTYQVTGDELDGPRGRIYLIKEMLEGSQTTTDTLYHLDRCLTCVNCETTCPSGVKYGELLEIGREYLENRQVRGLGSRVKRQLICAIFPFPNRFRPFYKLATMTGALPAKTHHNKPVMNVLQANKKVILLEGCVQSVICPEINDALKSMLRQLKIGFISLKQTHCCGAIHHHNGIPQKALDIFRHNIDLWWPHIENGCESIVMTASGCGSTIKDYSRLLAHDPEYTHKAAHVSRITKDASEFLATCRFTRQPTPYQTIAFHPPCTLQHAQGINHLIEPILTRSGYHCADFHDRHICCGSAGSYSLLQPGMAKQLKRNKIQNLMQANPDVIATANIGCQLHLQKDSPVPVKHWLELVQLAN